ncbi:MAG TPA: ECF transporter S component [Pseudogracilibacillus sp.]|nr:ECF transporter S component [Pseudogracilibacillus sp.]
MTSRLLRLSILLVIVPAIIGAGTFIFEDRKYVFISIILVGCTLLPFILSFEKKESNIRYMIVVAVLTALSVVGRFVFVALPGFKPVAAIVIITAVYFGSEAGFLVGALTAFISNLYFGHGPWTPFQMFAWGVIGVIAGLPWIRTMLEKHKWMIVMMGLFAGVFFSLLMDFWTVLSIDGVFNIPRYLTAVGFSLPFMTVYAVSNAIFLFIIMKPAGILLNRIKKKYGI